MAIIVEDGTGKTDSNSYVTTVEMDAFFTDRGFTIPATEAEKEALLIKAKDYLETYSYRGTRNTREQALSWPRTGVTIDGFAIGSDEIPTELKNAQMQAAYDLQSNDPLAVTGKGVKREKVDVIEVEYENGGSNQSVRFPMVESYLAKITLDGGFIRLSAMR